MLKFSSVILFVAFFQCLLLKDAASQCNISILNLPDTILVCKNTSIQVNPSVTITSGNPDLIDTTWNTSIGVSDSNLINPFFGVGTSSSNYILTITAVTPTNLITNGNFDLGNTTFSSAYVYGTGGVYGLLSAEGQFAVSTNPNLTHVNFASFGDHTTGTGNMMIINGASAPNVNVWCQTISVNPNTWYDFSAWGASCVSSNPAILQFSINGVLTGTPLALPSFNGVWSQFHTTWFSGSNTSINICITDQATAVSGNDFAIDDISFKELCTVSDSVYLENINLTPSIQTTIMLDCDKDSVQFVASNGLGTTPNSYQWYFGDASSSNAQNPMHTYSAQGVYNVKLVTELNGCSDSDMVVINTLHPMNADFIIVDTSCVNELLTISNNSTATGPFTSLYNWGDGTIETTGSHTYTQSGSYVITVTITDQLGCMDSMSRNIYVLDAPFVTFTASDDEICLGDPIFFSDSINLQTENFVWDFGDGSFATNVHNPKHTYDAVKNSYQVTLTGTNSKCSPSVFTQNIIVNPIPIVNLGKDTSFCPGLSGAITISNLVSSSGAYLWNNGSTNSSLIVEESGYYWLQLTDKGCTTSDSIWVARDCFLDIPNSFSPNGDGLNDYFFPREILSSGIVTFSMSIYNRWGEKIFETSKIDGRGWDGKFNGTLQAIGVYVYNIDVLFSNTIRKNFKGNVTLVR